MSENTAPTQEQKATKLFYHVNCKQLKGLIIKLTGEGQRHKKHLSILGLSSKETIGAGMKAVDASPFKTVFVVNENSGQVLFALSKNEEYVEAAKKKKNNPPPPPPPPPTSANCTICYILGGHKCDDLSDGSSICYTDPGGGRGGGSIDDPLETLAF